MSKLRFFLLTTSLAAFALPFQSAFALEADCFVQPSGQVPVPCPVDANNYLIVTPSPTAIGSKYTSTALESNHIVKTSAGSLLSVGVTLLVANSGGFVMGFDATTLPSNGAVNPDWCYQASAGITTTASWLWPWPFTTGQVVAFSTAANCQTLTASTTATFQILYH